MVANSNSIRLAIAKGELHWNAEKMFGWIERIFDEV